jgi:large subunit ribosomal protein L9
MATTTILLREDIDTVGGRGEIVKVKAGYARNYLLPHGLATLATKGNVKQIEGERAALLKKAAVEKTTAEAQREQMESISLEFERKAGEHGTLFGSVTSMDIAEALKAKGYEVDRRRINLREPIKETGEYTVNVKLHREVTLPVPVVVTAEPGSESAEKPAKKSRKKAAETTEASATEEPAAEAPETTGTADEGSTETPTKEPANDGSDA